MRASEAITEYFPPLLVSHSLSLPLSTPRLGKIAGRRKKEEGRMDKVLM
ncbi:MULTISPECIES: hypothetical protein [unclassified Microcoleus]